MQTRYRIDENNRLSVKRGKEKLKPLGKFLIDGKNRLIYAISESRAWRRKHRLPPKIVFEGSWSLNKNHDLILALTETKEQFSGEELYLKSELLSAKSDALVFSLGAKEKTDTYSIRLLQLKGKWQVDRYNHLCFLAKKARSQYDRLTLSAGWEVKNNTLTYVYQKTNFKRKKKTRHVITFSGFWQISEKDRIVYVLDTEGNSYFSFKVALQHPDVFAKKGEIKYRVGIGLRGGSLFKGYVFSLYGAWKLKKDLGLSFEIDYGGDRKKEIRFETSYRISEKNEIIFQLKNAAGGDLGISVVFTRTFLDNNAQWFLKLAKEAKDSRIEGGLNISF
jgi:hypothetical protein